MRGNFCSFVLRVHCPRIAVHYVVIDSVFYVGSVISRAKDTLFVGLILGEKEFMVSLKIHVSFTERAARCSNSVIIFLEGHLLEHGFRHSSTPGPGIAKPEGGQNMQ